MKLINQSGKRSELTFIPARERTLLSLNWPDWTGVVYMRASLNWRKEKNKGNTEAQNDRFVAAQGGVNILERLQIKSALFWETGMKNNVNTNWIYSLTDTFLSPHAAAHQEEHPRLHDLPGELHERALLQKHLQTQAPLNRQVSINIILNNIHISSFSAVFVFLIMWKDIFYSFLLFYLLFSIIPFFLYLLKEKIFSTSVFCLLLKEFTSAWTCCSHGSGLTGQMLWLTLPGWTISWCPVRLYWMCISFWKLSWKKQTNTGDAREVRMFSRKCSLELLHRGIRSYPLFHDVVSVVGHFFYDAEGSCMDRKSLNDHFSSLCNTTHNHWTLSLSNLGCLCSPQSLLEGSSNNLKRGLVG